MEGGRRSRSRSTSTSQEVRRLLPVSFSAGVQVRVKPEGTRPEREMMMGVGEWGREGLGVREVEQKRDKKHEVRRVLPVSFCAGVQVTARPEGTGPEGGGGNDDGGWREGEGWGGGGGAEAGQESQVQARRSGVCSQSVPVQVSR